MFCDKYFYSKNDYMERLFLEEVLDSLVSNQMIYVYIMYYFRLSTFTSSY